MSSAESLRYAKRYLQKAEEYLASAQDNVELEHAKSAGELRAALGTRPEAASAERALRELIAVKGDVEHGTTLIALAKAEPLVRRAQTLVDLAMQIVRPGH